MLRAGLLRHRVTLQKQFDGQNPDTGGLEKQWKDISTVWASVEDSSMRELVAAKAVQSEVSTRIVIRYRKDVDASCRVIHEGTIYNIAGVSRDLNSRREYITLACSTGVNDGTPAG